MVQERLVLLMNKEKTLTLRDGSSYMVCSASKLNGVSTPFTTTIIMCIYQYVLRRSMFLLLIVL